VLHDLLGLDPTFEPRFVRRYLEGHELIRQAVDHFAADVRGGGFPSEEETYHATRPDGRDVAPAAR
jgi:3-methyl-2-oxobutanoate hydroxymethyltransferase